jgi:hypothetical protein
MSEALRLDKADVDLKAATARLVDSKNGRPRLVHLPPIVVAELAQFPGGLEGTGRLFSFHAGGRLRELLKMTLETLGSCCPPGSPSMCSVILGRLGCASTAASTPTIWSRATAGPIRNRPIAMRMWSSVNRPGKPICHQLSGEKQKPDPWRIRGRWKKLSYIKKQIALHTGAVVRPVASGASTARQ